MGVRITQAVPLSRYEDVKVPAWLPVLPREPLLQQILICLCIPLLQIHQSTVAPVKLLLRFIQLLALCPLASDGDDLGKQVE